MKQMKYLLTLLFVSICAVQSAWADRSAPELPAAQNLVPQFLCDFVVHNRENFNVSVMSFVLVDLPLVLLADVIEEGVTELQAELRL